ncbi:MAG: hypothetical protein GXP31_19425 [Kiritimatiellaeota bacterium]|nr:hypothetical protein [Kiritimatiellota bacterium]
MAPRPNRAVAATALLVVLATPGDAAAGDGDGRWVRDALVIVSPGMDALGGKIPGAWYPRGRAEIALSQARAFAGRTSLKIRLKGDSGGCSRLVQPAGGNYRLTFSCRVFVPKGQTFTQMPAVHIWRSQGTLVARGNPVNETGKWVETTLDIERPAGQLFYVGVSAAGKKGARPFFYVDLFALKRDGEESLPLANADFEQDTGDKRAQIIADFEPDLVNIWSAAKLNKDGLFHKAGARIASWGKVEYDAALDWDRRLDEFKKTAAARDIDGKIVPRKGYPPFMYRMCHHSPTWHEYQKSGLLRILGENDALGQDNLCNPTFRGGKDQCFCQHCRRDFRKYLQKRFNTEQLDRMLPGPVEEFSIADYIKRIRPTHPGFKLLDDPVAREFVRAQYMYGKGFIADIAASIRRTAAKQGRVVPFFGNQGAAWGGNRFPVFSVVISDVVDAQCLENSPMEPYRRTHRHAWNALQYKLMAAATRWEKPVWPLIDVSAFDKFPTSERLYPGEALSNGAVPMLIWSPHTWPSERTYKAHAEYARFLNSYRALYLQRRPIARVALGYSVPTCVWRSFFSYWVYWRAASNHGRWIGTVARVLEDAHIPYDPIVFGHPDLLDDKAQLAALDNYDVLVLTEVDCVSEPQAAAVRRFAERGGRVVVIGEFGTRTEDYLPRRKSLLDQLKAVPGLRDRVVSLPASCVLDFKNLKSESEKVRTAYATLADAMRPEARLIQTNAPKTLWLNLWKDAERRRIALHMVNYNVDLQRHEFRAARNVEVSLDVPEDFAFNRILLLAPGTPATDLAFKHGNSAVSFRVPAIRCYAVAVLTTDNELNVADLIATARRNLDRARVAGRNDGASAKTARAALAEAERLYRARQYADAQKAATAAVQASAKP